MNMHVAQMVRSSVCKEPKWGALWRGVDGDKLEILIDGIGTGSARKECEPYPFSSCLWPLVPLGRYGLYKVPAVAGWRSAHALT